MGSLPDICELDTEEYDSALSSLEDLDSITDDNISYNQDEKLLYRSDGASENEIQLLKEIRYLKTKLEGERAENEKKLIKKREEIDHNMELINDLSQVASEVYEDNIRYKDEIQYWKQKCGWLSQQLNQIQLSKPEVEVRYMQKPKWLQDFHDIEDDLNEDEKEYVRNSIESKNTRLFLVKNVNRRKKGLFETYEERNAKTQKYIKHLKREKIEEVQKLREEFHVMLNESNKKVQE